MPHTTVSERKRKQAVEEPEVVVCDSDDIQSKSKARRVSTDVQEASHAVASHQTAEEVPVAATVASTITAAPEDSMESIGQFIQDLFHSDKVKVRAALAALNLDLGKDNNKSDKIQAVGGCHALVQLLKNCLGKAIDRIPACDQVTALNKLDELKTLNKTLHVITSLTFRHGESKVGIAAIGGVEAVVKIMKTFPKCQRLQEGTCASLVNLTCCSIGKKNAVASGGIEALIAAVKNHLGSAIICRKGCWALCNIVDGSKENVGLLIALGGGAAAAKVRTKWPDNNDVQIQVCKLADLIATEMKSWAV
jgi:hypothetical protein